MKIKAFVVAMGVSLGLAACGGGGSDNKPYADTFTVTAIDGYLQSANATAKCGTAQYAALTNANGKATISKPVSVTVPQCFVEITGNADTLDTHTKTKFPGVFLRSIPNQSGDLIVSPFTTLVAMYMTTTSNPQDYAAAVDTVAKMLGITTAQVTGDYTSDAAVLIKATSLATSNIWPQNTNDFSKLLSGGSAETVFAQQVELISDEVDTQIAALPAGTNLSDVYITVDVKGTEVSSTVKTIDSTNLPPVADFSYSAKDLVVSFDASKSTDSDGTIASYTWSFGDKVSAAGKTASHTYVAAGTYTVKLTVTDDKGASTSKSINVSVTAATGDSTNLPPVADFSYSAKDLVVSFDAGKSTDSDGTIASYTWSFGDKATGAGKTVSHTYAAAGTYTVKLTVTDDKGASASKSTNVTVTAATGGTGGTGAGGGTGN